MGTLQSFGSHCLNKLRSAIAQYKMFLVIKKKETKLRQSKDGEGVLDLKRLNNICRVWGRLAWEREEYSGYIKIRLWFEGME